jgi:hypothetical protein
LPFSSPPFFVVVVMVVVLAEVPDELSSFKSPPSSLDSQKLIMLYLSFESDDTDQIHDETARQSRWALGIGLTIR